MEKLVDAVRVLSVEIGPRGSASEAEGQAAEYAAERLRRAGFEVKIEPFRGLTTFSLPYGLIYSGFVLAAPLHLLSPAASFALALLSLAAFLTEIHALPTLSRILPKGQSQNVVGVRRPKGEVKRRVVISAHLDSSKAALLWHPRMVAGFRRSFLTMVGAMLAIVLLGLVGLFLPLGRVWWAQLACSLYLSASVILLVHRELFMEHTPGANDNASGVAVLLAAAEELSDLQTTELWAVATGCEESGLCGMLAFMDAHRFDRENTYFINLDNCGAGRVAYITAEGVLLRYPSDAELLRLASQVIAEEGLDVEPRAYHTLTTDALVPLTRGHKAMGVMAFDEQGVLPNWHWPTDTVENVDQTAMDNALRLVVGVVRKLDSHR